jgi:hypothetical protein
MYTSWPSNYGFPSRHLVVPMHLWHWSMLITTVSYSSCWSPGLLTVCTNGRIFHEHPLTVSSLSIPKRMQAVAVGTNPTRSFYSGDNHSDSLTRLVGHHANAIPHGWTISQPALFWKNETMALAPHIYSYQLFRNLNTKDHTRANDESDCSTLSAPTRWQDIYLVSPATSFYPGPPCPRRTILSLASGRSVTEGWRTRNRASLFLAVIPCIETVEHRRPQNRG